ncbi:MAG: flagellar filament capping protein FliD [Planctomycetes bacterium]|nr:flagellar filament capping protein FliD [Planctomycetota bacterium]
MGSITTGIGLISGIDIASLIESLLTLESRRKFDLQDRVADLQAQQTALLDINARLLSFKSAASSFRVNSTFNAATATSSDEDVLTATASNSAQPGTYDFIVKRLVSTSQQLSRGFASSDSTPLGLDQLSFEFGNGRLARDQTLEELNGGQGADRGSILINDGNGGSATVDLTDVVTISEVVDRINTTAGISVTASYDDDHLVITDTSGGAGNLTITDAAGDTTATDLGIAGTAAGAITGSSIYFLSGDTSLASLNDGNGVLARNNVTDLRITARDGTVFDVDLGRVDLDIGDSTLLSALNDGNGVDIDGDTNTKDIKFIDRSGIEHEIDLSGVTTVGGLRGRVSSETGGVITLTVDAVTGDRFVVNDSSGGTGLLQILGSDENGTTVAEDLGILNEAGVLAATHTGEVIPSTIDQAVATTLQDVVDRINNAKDGGGGDNGGHILAAISGDGLRLEITDTVSGAGNLIITSTASNADAAAQLGLDTGAVGVAQDSVSGQRLIAGLNTVLLRSVNGGAGTNLETIAGAGTLRSTTQLADLFAGVGLQTNANDASADVRLVDTNGTTYEVELDGLTTVQDLIDAVDTTTGGNVAVTIEGQSLRFSDAAGGGGSLTVDDLNGATVTTQIGVNGVHPSGTILSFDTNPLNTEGLEVDNRLGVQTTIDLGTAESVQDVVDLINAAGAGVTAAINDAGNGITITDTTGGNGNLTLGGNAATALGITADVAADTVQGTNLQLQYVSSASKLSDLNYGRGIGKGSFRITDGLGASATVTIGGTEESMQDILDEINSRGLAVTARINDDGDGIIIEEDAAALAGQTPFVKIKVETVNGSTASDLNILGESDDVIGGFIDGSYEAKVDLATSDSLDDVVSKINDAGIPINATVINTGTGATPFRLNMSSAISGAAGDLIIDTGGVDLGLTALATGGDARVFFGGDDAANALLITSSTNTLTGVIPGVTLDLNETSDTAVSVTITRDTETIVSSVKQLVTTFNDAIGRLDDYDFYNSETEERGVLLSDPTVAQVRSALYRVATGKALNVTGSLQYLSQAGIRFNREGQMTFDEGRFRDAYASDPDSVEALFATYDAASGGTETVVQGVTIENNELQYNALGFGNLFDRLLDDLTNSIDGTLTNANNSFDTRIDLIEDRITFLDDRLEDRRTVLTRQFAAMEDALARLQAQSGSLGALASSVSLARGS